MSFVHTTIMKKRQCLLFMRAVQSAMWWSLGSRKSYLPCKYACYKSRAIREVAVAPGFHVGPSSVGPSVRQLLGSPRQHAIQPSPPLQLFSKRNYAKIATLVLVQPSL